MPIRAVLSLIFAGLLWLPSCVTVNIYFPAKEVEAGVKSLEEELLKLPPEPGPSPKPERQSRLERDEHPSFPVQRLAVLVTEAWAQGDISQQINEELKSMPEVVEAYGRMAQRLREIDRLRSQGAVGEGKDGRLVLRADRSQVSPGDVSLIDQENRDREVVITGIAKAVLKLNRQAASGPNLERSRPQAAELFAGIRRDSAKPGWWIQLADGTWRQK
jgi:Protein of unknown function (DUF1318)